MRQKSFIVTHRFMRNRDGHYRNGSSCRCHHVGINTRTHNTLHFIANFLFLQFCFELLVVLAFSARCFLNFPLCLHFTCSFAIYDFRKFAKTLRMTRWPHHQMICKNCFTVCSHISRIIFYRIYRMLFSFLDFISNIFSASSK